jgi:chromosome segregation ATPase
MENKDFKEIIKQLGEKVEKINEFKKDSDNLIEKLKDLNNQINRQLDKNIELNKLLSIISASNDKNEKSIFRIGEQSKSIEDRIKKIYEIMENFEKNIDGLNSKLDKVDHTKITNKDGNKKKVLNPKNEKSLDDEEKAKLRLKGLGISDFLIAIELLQLNTQDPLILSKLTGERTLRIKKLEHIKGMFLNNIYKDSLKYLLNSPEGSKFRDKIKQLMEKAK